jgi:uncharacterized membrane protein
MAAASLVLRSTAVMAYLPVLLVASVFTGFITGVTALGFLELVRKKLSGST